MQKISSKERQTQIVFEKWAKLVDPKIKEILNLSIDRKNHQLVDYQVAAGGKRFRPALTIAGFFICGGKDIEDVLYLAAGLEILHNCTLIYDDIIDNSRVRRGKQTVWAKFGRSIAECVGIDYAASVFQAANKSKYPVEISEIFARTMKTVAEGEILDILFEQSGRKGEKYVLDRRYQKITEKDYLQMVTKKTASLIQACCQVGAISAEAGKREISALGDYGFNLGVAFQIRDDILDIFGEEKEFGKKIGKDIEERKLGNIVIFYALKELSQRKSDRLLKILRQSKIRRNDIREAIDLINKTKAKETAFFLGEKYVRKAKENLKKLPQNESNKLLAEIADFVIKREK